jgi:hypothetical protein
MPRLELTARNFQQAMALDMQRVRAEIAGQAGTS